MRPLLAALALFAAPALAQTTPGGPAAHRLMFTPTARAIPAGDVALGLTEILIPNVSAGFGGGVSLGVGVILGPEPVERGILFVEPKLTVVDRAGVDVALGATAQIDPTDDREASIFPYAVATFGAAETPGTFAATVGVGTRINVRPAYSPVHYYAEPGIAPTIAAVPDAVDADDHETYLVAAPVLFGGAELRATERVTVLVELAALPDQDVAQWDYYPCPYCYGPLEGDLSLRAPSGTRGSVHYDGTVGTAVRYATRRAAVDLGAAFIIESASYGDAYVSPAPWLNVTLGLGE